MESLGSLLQKSSLAILPYPPNLALLRFAFKELGQAVNPFFEE